MISPRIFISYAKSDQQFAERLASDLSQAGLWIWIDLWEIDVGDSIVQRINEGLGESSHLALILSPSSIQSKWVMTELSSGLMRELSNKGIRVLPLLLHDCEIPAIISDKKYADFRSDYGNGLDQLIESILSKDQRQNLARQRLEILNKRWRIVQQLHNHLLNFCSAPVVGEEVSYGIRGHHFRSHRTYRIDTKANLFLLAKRFIESLSGLKIDSAIIGISGAFKVSNYNDAEEVHILRLLATDGFVASVDSDNRLITCAGETGLGIQTFVEFVGNESSYSSAVDFLKELREQGKRAKMKFKGVHIRPMHFDLLFNVDILLAFVHRWPPRVYPRHSFDIFMEYPL